tara:strand:+ start:320 stop:2017 length:1698 start_codon:yes stop_codon:yes gene_type:complete
MKEDQEFSSINETNDFVLENEIDLREVLKSVRRNSKLIGLFTLSGLLISGLNYIIAKRTYMGDFQIVLNDSQSQQLTIGSGVMQFLGGIGGSRSNEIATEVEILKSPYILMDSFEFANEKSESDLRFRTWKKNLNINLQSGTRILNIEYKNHDKDLILPVLNKISSSYQQYSINKKKEKLENGLDFVKDQLAIYDKKSLESLQKAQDFSIQHNLSVIEGEEHTNQSTKSIINVEKESLEAGNEMRILNVHLNQIKDLKDNSDEIMYFAEIYLPNKTIDIESMPNWKKLIQLKTDLQDKRLIFKDSDKSIQDLLRKKTLLLKSFKEEVIGIINANKKAAQAKLTASKRPAGVLIEYRTLLSDARKDSYTLNELKDNFRSLLLEKARSELPWKLITNPTLRRKPIYPKKKIFLALGLFGGLISGFAVTALYEKKKDIIYSLTELKSLLKYPLFSELSVNNQQDWEEYLAVFVENSLSDFDGEIGLITVGEINDSEQNALSKCLKTYLKGRKLIITKKVIETRKCSKLILLTKLGLTKRQEAIDMNKKLLLQKSKVLGMLVLTDFKKI